MQAQISSHWFETHSSEFCIPPEHVWMQLDHPDQAMPAWSLLQALAYKSTSSMPPPPQDQV